MRIAYVATDEVNQALAARMAAQCGAMICHLRPGEVHADGLFDAVLYNLDGVPREQRPAFLEGLCLGKPDCPQSWSPHASLVCFVVDLLNPLEAGTRPGGMGR
jgi:hypothetical protein